MAEDNAATTATFGRVTTGIVIGLAIGIAISTFLLFRLGGYFVFVLSVGLAPVVIGPVIGALLSRTGAVPNLRPGPCTGLALAIVTAPIVAGSVETGLRSDPFTIPGNTMSAKWQKHPWGERVLTFESREEVPAIFDKLVLAANDAGWICQTCVFQETTGTGYASFRSGNDAKTKPKSFLGLEVWPGEMALYGSADSEFSQVRVFHNLQTQSPGYTVLITTLLLLGAVSRPLFRKRMV